jgi:hypothetical protein
MKDGKIYVIDDINKVELEELFKIAKNKLRSSFTS